MIFGALSTMWVLAQQVDAPAATIETAVITLFGASPFAGAMLYGWSNANKRAEAAEKKYDGMVERVFEMVQLQTSIASESKTTLHEVQTALTEAAKVASQRAAIEGNERQLDELARRLKSALEGESR